ncbi:uncharacterized protein VTP21DRAFT_9652 [Calcarisporiella thermophila]|uniref:uncharacterized protein n=1 Tax=Calcarisporiella thermophila TaxID=911321 RepID=UPI00374475BB
MTVMRPSDQSKDLPEKIAARFNFIKKPVMTVAHVLDPKHSVFTYKKKSLEEIQQYLSERYPEEEADEIYTDLLLFNTKSAPFNSRYLWSAAKNIDPIAWWNAHEKLSPKLAKLAIIACFISCFRKKLVNIRVRDSQFWFTEEEEEEKEEEVEEVKEYIDNMSQEKDIPEN